MILNIDFFGITIVCCRNTAFSNRYAMRKNCFVVNGSAKNGSADMRVQILIAHHKQARRLVLAPKRARNISTNVYVANARYSHTEIKDESRNYLRREKTSVSLKSAGCGIAVKLLLFRAMQWTTRVPIFCALTQLSARKMSGPRVVDLTNAAKSSLAWGYTAG
jgi:hypothetical protein